MVTDASRSRSSSFRFLILILAVILPCVARGEEEDKRKHRAIADTSSPRATLNSFRSACDEVYQMILAEHRDNKPRDEERHRQLGTMILSCLNLSETAEFVRRDRGREAAVCLKEILDRVWLPPESEIPGEDDIIDEEGNIVVTKWRVPRTKIVIRLVKEGDRQGDFLFSPETVALAPSHYREVQHLDYNWGASEGFYEWFLSAPGHGISPLVQRLPRWAVTTFWGKHAVWQWLGLAIVSLLGFLLMIGLYRFGRQRVQKKKPSNALGYFFTIVYPLAAVSVPLFVNSIVESQIRLSGKILAAVSFSAHLVFLLGLVLVIIGAGGRIGEILVSSPRINTKDLDAQLIRILCRVVALVAATIVFLQGGQFLGIPLSTLLASAGVGGFAFALAAQDSLKNLFGSIMIILDKPFRVGERIVVGKFDGVVEEIGLRSTRLRLLTGHQATVPNEEMARSHIENIGRRPHIRRLAVLRLPLDTPTEKAERAVTIVQDVLADHEGMDDKLPPRAFLSDIDSDSLTIKMIYWYHPPKYWDFLAGCQVVNLEIKERFEKEGIAFAPPTTTTRLVTSEGSAATEDALPAETVGPE